MRNKDKGVGGSHILGARKRLPPSRISGGSKGVRSASHKKSRYAWRRAATFFASRPLTAARNSVAPAPPFPFFILKNQHPQGFLKPACLFHRNQS